MTFFFLSFYLHRSSYLNWPWLLTNCSRWSEAVDGQERRHISVRISMFFFFFIVPQHVSRASDERKRRARVIVWHRRCAVIQYFFTETLKRALKNCDFEGRHENNASHLRIVVYVRPKRLNLEHMRCDRTGWRVIRDENRTWNLRWFESSLPMNHYPNSAYGGQDHIRNRFVSGPTGRQ